MEKSTFLQMMNETVEQIRRLSPDPQPVDIYTVGELANMWLTLYKLHQNTQKIKSNEKE